MLRRAATATGGALAKVFDRKTLTVAVVLVVSLAVLFSVVDNVRSRRQTEDSNAVLRETNRQLVQLAGQATTEAKKNGQQIVALQQQIADQNRQIAALRKQLQDAGLPPSDGPTPAPRAQEGAGPPRTSGPGAGGPPSHPRPSAAPSTPPQQPPPGAGGPGGVIGVVCGVPIVHELLC